MAIVKMKRLFLAALKSDSEALLNELMKLSCVEISSPEEGLAREEMTELLQHKEKSGTDLESRVKQLSTAIETLERVGKLKMPLFVKLRAISEKDAQDRVDSAKDTVGQIMEYIGRLNELKNEENRLTAAISSLRPYEALDVDLGLTRTARTNLFVGMIPVDMTESVIDAVIAEKDVEMVLEVLNADNVMRYVFGLYPCDREEENQSALKQLGFQRAAFREMQGTVSENLELMTQRIKSIVDERVLLEYALTRLVPELPDLQTAYDILAVQMQRQKESERLLYSRKALFFEGWIPEKQLNTLDKVLAAYDCTYEVRDPAEDEDPPVLLENSKLVAPFGVITEMYSLPLYGSVDPNPFISFFYFVFFGMMLGDAALGLILAAVCFTIIKKYNPKGTLGNLIHVLGMCGISAIIWGLLFGSFFGDVIKVVSTHFFGHTVILKPLWFDPLADPMKLLVLSLVFGGIHIFVGMGIKIYMLVREGKILDAIFDVVLWYVLIIGSVGFLFLDFGKTVFQWMMIISAVGIILTAGREKKNPLMKLFCGFTGLYNITGYMSDVLSYSRLLALGLSSGVVASVFNTLGALGSSNFIGVIVFGAVFLFGTALNIFINTLGAYVHTCRLQYVEFFSKFYEPGGRTFVPLKRKTKYIEMID